MLVLHYTGMPDAPGAVARLTDPRSQVSSHYLVDGEGTISSSSPKTAVPGTPDNPHGVAKRT